VIQREHDGVRWELQPDFAPLLAEVLKAPGDWIKESPVKQVTLHRAGAQKFYVKRYLHAGVPLRPLKFLFKPTQAEQEWKLAGQLEARGIPIVRHVALGLRRTWTGVQESILITEGYAGVQLNETPDVDPVVVRAFVERMHEQGVLQKDLHPANLLVRREPLELRLVDLHGTVVKPQLSPAERDENFAVLRGYLAIPVSPRVERLSVRLRRERLRARARRSLRQNRDFVRIHLGGLMWQVRVPLTEPARTVLDGPDAFLARKANLLKAGRSATVGGGDGLVLKRYNLRRFARLLKDLFRSSPAAASFRKAYHLELAGIPTARPLAMAERRRFRFLINSYFLMEEIPGAMSLDEWLKANPWSKNEIKAVGALVGRLHGQGFSHRDLKASNILFDTLGRPHLIDLDGLAYVGEIGDSRAAGDLNRLARGGEKWIQLKSETRRLFLRAYCRARGSRRIPRSAGEEI
jgi:tRNA A-37 threonylcarbamoyl transferase component Bud32